VEIFDLGSIIPEMDGPIAIVSRLQLAGGSVVTATVKKLGT
jgi:hypothetical protein